jgi:hypothetical protein
LIEIPVGPFVKEWSLMAQARVRAARKLKLHDRRIDSTSRSNYEIDRDGVWGEGAYSLFLPTAEWFKRSDGVDPGWDLTLADGTKVDVKATQHQTGNLVAFSDKADIGALALVDIVHRNVVLAGWLPNGEWKRVAKRKRGICKGNYCVGQDLLYPSGALLEVRRAA